MHGTPQHRQHRQDVDMQQALHTERRGSHHHHQHRQRPATPPNETDSAQKGGGGGLGTNQSKPNKTYMEFWQFSFRHYTQRLGCVLNT